MKQLQFYFIKPIASYFTSFTLELIYHCVFVKKYIVFISRLFCSAKSTCRRFKSCIFELGAFERKLFLWARNSVLTLFQRLFPERILQQRQTPAAHVSATSRYVTSCDVKFQRFLPLLKTLYT